MEYLVTYACYYENNIPKKCSNIDRYYISQFLDNMVIQSQYFFDQRRTNVHVARTCHY